MPFFHCATERENLFASISDDEELQRQIASVELYIEHRDQIELPASITHIQEKINQLTPQVQGLFNTYHTALYRQCPPVTAAIDDNSALMGLNEAQYRRAASCFQRIANAGAIDANSRVPAHSFCFYRDRGQQSPSIVLTPDQLFMTNFVSAAKSDARNELITALEKLRDHYEETKRSSGKMATQESKQVFINFLVYFIQNVSEESITKMNVCSLKDFVKFVINSWENQRKEKLMNPQDNLSLQLEKGINFGSSREYYDKKFRMKAILYDGTFIEKLSDIIELYQASKFPSRWIVGKRSEKFLKKASNLDINALLDDLIDGELYYNGLKYGESHSARQHFEAFLFISYLKDNIIQSVHGALYQLETNDFELLKDFVPYVKDKYISTRRDLDPSGLDEYIERIRVCIIKEFDDLLCSSEASEADSADMFNAPMTLKNT